MLDKVYARLAPQTLHTAIAMIAPVRSIELSEPKAEPTVTDIVTSTMVPRDIGGAR